MTCCPDGAWKNLHNKEYKPKGEVEHIEATGINVYKVGKSEKCLIWNYTIFGFDGGRIKQMADFFADHGKCKKVRFYKMAKSRMYINL